MASAVVTGVLVGRSETPYDFTDRETGKPVSGVTRKAWIQLDLFGEPEEIRFRDDNNWSVIEDLEPFAPVSVAVDIQARNNRIVQQAQRVL